MPRTLTSPDRQAETPQVTPPIEATFAVETAQGLAPVRDAVSRAVINKSNIRVNDLLKNSLKASLRLSKTMYGNVSQVFKTFTGLRGLLRGR